MYDGTHPATTKMLMPVLWTVASSPTKGLLLFEKPVQCPSPVMEKADFRMLCPLFVCKIIGTNCSTIYLGREYQLNWKEKPCSILIVVVNWHHCANLKSEMFHLNMKLYS